MATSIQLSLSPDYQLLQVQQDVAFMLGLVCASHSWGSEQAKSASRSPSLRVRKYHRYQEKIPECVYGGKNDRITEAFIEAEKKSIGLHYLHFLPSVP